jgi:hypothetical protein
MSAETAHVIYTICVLALGYTLHVGCRAFMDYHDAQKNHEIHRLQWENDQLKRQLAEAPAPLTEEAPSPAPIRTEPAPRKRRSPANASKQEPSPACGGRWPSAARSDEGFKKVPSAIPQADLGRMQAQLAAYGRCRTVFAGGKKL